MRIFSLLIIILGISASAYAQSSLGKINLNKYIRNIPSPTAASLGQYADVPVSLYGGTPQINIPIYDIDMGSYSLPISLSYHASGIKVAQEASWVGLGWALNAGGVITHTIRDRDDLTTGYNAYPNLPPFEPGDFEFQELEDTEPDIFSYNIAGYSGKFIIKKGGAIFAISPDNLLKIEHKKGRFEQFDDYWDITTPDGIRYSFQAQEIKSGYYLGFQGLVDATGYEIDEYNSKTKPNEISAWYLTSIILPNGDTIDFSYDEGNETILSPLSCSQSSSDYMGTFYKIGEAPLPNKTSTVFSRDITYTEQTLKEIRWRYGKIIFEHSDRKDLQGYYPETSSLHRRSQKLDAIKIFSNKSPEPIQTTQFCNSYFGNIENSETAYLMARLRLDALIISGTDQVKEYSYKFEYDQKYRLPAKDLHSYDLWGYINSVEETISRGSLIPVYNVPEVMVVSPPEYNTEIVIPESLDDYNKKKRTITIRKGPIYNGSGARYLNTTYLTTGMLIGITYPTGGKTSFVYEPNQYYDSELQQNVNGGGARIKKIISPAYTKEYTYTLDNGVSSGIMISPPRFHDFCYDFAAEYSPSADSRCAIIQVDYFLNRFSTSRSPLEGSINGQSIGYSQVKETKVTDGELIIEESLYYNIPEQQYFLIDFPNKENVINGKLKERKQYANDELVKKEIYEYRPQKLDSVLAYKCNTFLFEDNYYTYSYWCPSISRSETYYSKIGDKTYETHQTETYQYNAKTFLLEKTKGTLPNGETWEKWLRYTADMRGIPYVEMQSKNMLNLPMQELFCRNNKVIESALVTYQKIHFDDQNIDMFLPHRMYTQKEKAGVSANLNMELYYSSGRLPQIYGNTYTSFQGYDCKGNCTQYTSEDSVSIVSLWGPDSPYPIAVMRNLTLGDLSRIIDPNASVKGERDPYCPGWIIEDLYKWFPQAHISSCTYHPLIGQERSSGPNRLMTRYRYDPLGRIKLKLDHNYNILERNTYKYATKP